MLLYVVTYCDEYTDPTPIVFDNYEAAEECFKYYNERYEWCVLDYCETLNKFVIPNKNQFSLEE